MRVQPRGPPGRSSGRAVALRVHWAVSHDVRRPSRRSEPSGARGARRRAGRGHATLLPPPSSIAAKTLKVKVTSYSLLGRPSTRTRVGTNGRARLAPGLLHKGFIAERGRNA